MQAPRQVLYNGGAGAGVQAPGAGMAQISGPPAAEDASLSTLRNVLGAAAKGVELMAREYNARQTALVDEELLRVDREFEEWKQGYMESSQGANALDARQAFTAKYEELAQAAIERFDGPANETHGDLLKRRLYERGLFAVRDGGRYQAAQRSAFEKSQWEGQLAEFDRLVDSDPYDQEGIAFAQRRLMESWSAKNPGLDPAAMADRLRSRAAERSMAAALAQAEASGDCAAAETLLNGGYGGARPHSAAQSAENGASASGANKVNAGGFSGGLGVLSAGEESGEAGIMAIGWDRMGGTSYGKYQISSRQGGMEEWLNQFAADGAEQKRIADYIRGGGPLDSGGVNGPTVERYREMAAKYGEMMEASQHAYIMKTHYGRALKGSGEDFRQLVEGDRALQEMVFSTAVQHGGGGAASIFRKVYKPGMDKAELVRAVYARRAQCFGGSSPKVRAAAQKRMERECEAVLQMLGEGFLRGQSPRPSQAAQAAEPKVFAGGEREGRELFPKSSLPSQTPNPSSPAILPGLSPALASRYRSALERLRERDMAQARRALAERVDDGVAALMDGRDVDDLPSEAELVSVLGAEKGGLAAGRIAQARSLNDFAREAHGMSGERIEAVLREAAPAPGPDYESRARIYSLKVKKAQEILKRRAEDPAGYIVSLDSSVARARADFLQSGTAESFSVYAGLVDAAGELLGMESPPLLPRADAAMLAQRMLEDKDPVSALKELGRAAGRRWPRLGAQIGKDLGAVLNVAASGMPEAAARDLIAASRDKEFVKNSDELLFAGDSGKKDYQYALHQAMEDMERTFLSGGDSGLVRGLRQCVDLCARQNMLKLNMERDAAIEKAANDVILDRYHIIENEGSMNPFRVPKSRIEDESLAEAGARAAKKRILENPGKYSLAKIPGTNGLASYESMLRQSGHWVVDEQESGLVFFVGPRALEDKEGNLVKISWKELARLGEGKGGAFKNIASTGDY